MFMNATAGPTAISTFFNQLMVGSSLTHLCNKATEAMGATIINKLVSKNSIKIFFDAKVILSLANSIYTSGTAFLPSFIHQLVPNQRRGGSYLKINIKLSFKYSPETVDLGLYFSALLSVLLLPKIQVSSQLLCPL